MPNTAKNNLPGSNNILLWRLHFVLTKCYSNILFKPFKKSSAQLKVYWLELCKTRYPLRRAYTFI